ncbi:hypothetical protein [Pseudoalteromonas sp. SCQQ13]|uniref:hypothetical protein n=1 Tax=Pseudoalteromonas sp. SCQQ13 TaxID=2792066 RepID=UPI0018CD6A23|nr:hypothetical protein [Pseudoalteromonas sp. SCQQ13]MBH0093344.1 hypothetical protein [Pseudoalteromonas sp. SCQQ13]
MPHYLENYHNDFADQFDAHLSRFYIKALKVKALDKPVKTLNELLKPHYKHPTHDHTNEVRVLLTAAAQAKKEGNIGVKLPLGNDLFYNSDASRGQKLNNDRFKCVCLAAEKLQLLDLYIGTQANLDGERRLSRIVFTNELMNMIEVDKVKNYFPDIPKEFKPVICKDLDSKQEIKLPKGYGVDSLQQTRINAWNEVLKDTTVTINGVVTQSPMYQKHLVKCANTKEVFTVRNYVFGGGIQTQSNKNNERSTITLNAECCTGLDVKSIHPNLLYTKVGITVAEDFDAYTVNHDHLQYKTEMRDLMKVVFMCILFSGSKSGATNAIKNKLQSDLRSEKRKYSWLLNDENEVSTTAKHLHDSLANHNKPIQQFFYSKKLWLELQSKDAEIFDNVIADLVEEREPVLSWHDGVVFPTRLKQKVSELIFKHWDAVLGNTANLVIKEEFCNTADVVQIKRVFKPSFSTRNKLVANDPVTIAHCVKQIGACQAISQQNQRVSAS